MRFAETEVAGAIVVDPVVHRDSRGFFLETFHSEKYAAAGIPPVFVQDNHSRSTRGTLRDSSARKGRNGCCRCSSSLR